MPSLAGSGGPSTPNHKWSPKERKAYQKGKGCGAPHPGQIGPLTGGRCFGLHKGSCCFHALVFFSHHNKSGYTSKMECDPSGFPDFFSLRFGCGLSSCAGDLGWVSVLRRCRTFKNGRHLGFAFRREESGSPGSLCLTF